MAKSVLALARLIAPMYDLTCFSPRAGVEPFTESSLQARFTMFQERQTSRFLERAQAEGNNWRTAADFINDSPDPETRILKRNYLKLRGWISFKGALLEAMCLLATLSQFQSRGRRVVDVFGQGGPIIVRSGARDLYLWTRPTLPLTKSRLRAKPDLLCTSSPNPRDLTTIEWILECKCRGLLTSHDLRAEFGKAFDLESPSYTLVVYRRPAATIMNASNAFGIDIQVFPLVTDKREDYITGVRDLAIDTIEMLKASRERKKFAQKVLAKGSALEKKLSET